MKFKLLVIIILLCSNYILIAQKAKYSNCEMLDSILNNKTLRQSIGVEGNSNKIIRIIDKKKYLKKCKVTKSYSYYIGNHAVGITNIVPLDINTGLFADIVILDISKKSNNIQFDIFFVNNDCENNVKHKYMCSGVFSCNKSKLIIERINFSHID